MTAEGLIYGQRPGLQGEPLAWVRHHHNADLSLFEWKPTFNPDDLLLSSDDVLIEGSSLPAVIAGLEHRFPPMVPGKLERVRCVPDNGYAASVADYHLRSYKYVSKILTFEGLPLWTVRDFTSSDLVTALTEFGPFLAPNYPDVFDRDELRKFGVLVGSITSGNYYRIYRNPSVAKGIETRLSNQLEAYKKQNANIDACQALANAWADLQNVIDSECVNTVPGEASIVFGKSSYSRTGGGPHYYSRPGRSKLNPDAPPDSVHNYKLFNLWAWVQLHERLFGRHRYRSKYFDLWEAARARFRELPPKIKANQKWWSSVASDHPCHAWWEAEMVAHKPRVRKRPVEVMDGENAGADAEDLGRAREEADGNRPEQLAAQ